MKKNKVIIPAMAMILFSTAASISGTVAWFTASRVFQTSVGQFSVVETEGNLDVVMTPLTAGGTEAGAQDNTVQVRDTNVDSKGSFKTGDQPGAPATGDLWYDGTGSAMKKYNGSAWEAITMVAGDYYYCTTDQKYYQASSGTAIAVEANTKNPVVLTHGSVNHTNKHAFIVDSDDTSSYLDRKAIDGTGGDAPNWCYQDNVTIKDKVSVDRSVDVYVAVAWKMTFTYTFASDTAPVGIYLDLGKSKFVTPTEKHYDFTQNAASGRLEDTAKGFRIAFMGEDRQVVWANNKPVSSPDNWAKDHSGGYANGAKVVYNGKIYQATATVAENADWDASKWTPTGQITLNNGTDPAVGTDAAYVATTSTTGNYTAANFVNTTALESDYTRVTPATEYEETPTASHPERLCVLTADDLEHNSNVVELYCAAWFEGTDPNVVTGAAMACLSANITVYARSLIAGAAS